MSRSLRLSPMNPAIFNALAAIYPMYMARLKTSRFRRWAKDVREIRQRCYAEPKQRVTTTDVMALCHTARLALGDDAKAREYVQGSVKRFWNDDVMGKTVREWVTEDFAKNAGQLR